MIEERYVSFEVAQLLDTKDFDGLCKCYYSFNKKYHELRHSDLRISKKDCCEDEVLCPTQQMVIDWLELKHNIFIAVAPRPTTMDYKRVTAYIYKIEERGYSLKRFIDAGSRRDAIDKAIKYSLGERLFDYE